MKNSHPAQALAEKSVEVSQLLKALAHPIRLRLLCSLVDGPKTVGELVEVCEVSQSGMSQFLARMKLEGILSSERDGTRVIYEIADPKMRALMMSLKRIYCP